MVESLVLWGLKLVAGSGARPPTLGGVAHTVAPQNTEPPAPVSRPSAQVMAAACLVSLNQSVPPPLVGLGSQPFTRAGPRLGDQHFPVAQLP